MKRGLAISPGVEQQGSLNINDPSPDWEAQINYFLAADPVDLTDPERLTGEREEKPSKELVVVEREEPFNAAEEDDQKLWETFVCSRKWCGYCRSAVRIGSGHDLTASHSRQVRSLRAFRDFYRSQIHPVRAPVERWLLLRSAAATSSRISRDWDRVWTSWKNLDVRSILSNNQ